MPTETRLPITDPSFRGRAWVYYIRKGDRIKIGTSKNLSARMNALRPDEILALEPGSFKRETYRHRQFDKEHIEDPVDTEWFVPSRRLDAHIAVMAQRHPLPALPLRYRMKAVTTMTIDMPEVPEEHPAEITAPIPRIGARTRPKLRRQKRKRKRTYYSVHDLPEPPRVIGPAAHTFPWPILITVYAICAGLAARVFDNLWIIPIAIVLLMLFYHCCDVPVQKRALERAVARAHVAFWSVVRREGLGSKRGDE